MMGETEVRTADASGTVQNASQQTTKPKSQSAKASGRSATKREVKTQRGIPVTPWDNDKQDPNKRKHVGESPDGEGNEAS